LLQRLVKQRRESAEIFAEKGRKELAEQELFQAEVIESFLPKQASEEEITAAVKETIEQTGAGGMKDMGKVMGILAKKFAGKADNRMISEIVKKELAT
jgi:hypothetical protein